MRDLKSLVLGRIGSSPIARTKSKEKQMNKPNNEEISKYIEKCIKERRDWANSSEGYKALGAGSPTIPGLQEYYQILSFVNNEKWPDR